jgi:hypothetical protein
MTGIEGAQDYVDASGDARSMLTMWVRPTRDYEVHSCQIQPSLLKVLD